MRSFFKIVQSIGSSYCKIRCTKQFNRIRKSLQNTGEIITTKIEVNYLKIFKKKFWCIFVVQNSTIYHPRCVTIWVFSSRGVVFRRPLYESVVHIHKPDMAALKWRAKVFVYGLNQLKMDRINYPLLKNKLLLFVLKKLTGTKE